MLTRLKVTGFKNLVEVDVRFGPFTCIAGTNGVGKSNLLDAITFLSALADLHVVEAAMRVRDEQAPNGDVLSIFHRYGSEQQRRMSFEAEMIIPERGTDDLGQEARATTTFVRYKLILELKAEAAQLPGPLIEIVSEELTHVRASEFRSALGFPHESRWLKSAVKGKRSAPFYISTTEDLLGQRTISVHQDAGPGSKSGGRSRKLSAKTLPRTVLSSANAAENPTATLVRQEMRAWKLLQLEPSALRKPDNFTAPTSMGSDGSHLPATLSELARQSGAAQSNSDSKVYTMAANRLAELLDDVRALKIDRDEKRSLLTLLVAGKGGTFHPARSLSDGTLRFLALAVLDLDPRSQGVICMEEPENGIHPARIPAILSLLQDIAVDTDMPIGLDNPLRQVIINTHSPAVVAQIPEDSLLMAQSVRVIKDKRFTYDKVIFSALGGTWRAQLGSEIVPKGKILSYLSPILSEPEVRHVTEHQRRVVDNPEIQLGLFGE